jgi:hypothetical protein
LDADHPENGVLIPRLFTAGVTKVSAREVFDQIFFTLSTNSIPADPCRIASLSTERASNRGNCLFDISALTGNAVALSLVHPAAKKPLGLVNFDAKLAVSTAGQRRGGGLLVMLRAAHKGSLRSAAHSRIVV